MKRRQVLIREARQVKSTSSTGR